jgi:hypothetical protein
MGANNDDFFNQVFYHGTVHPFKEGDIIDPAQSAWGGVARATPDLEYAARQAAFKEIGASRVAKKEGREAPAGRVFEVRPIPGDPNKPWEQPEKKGGWAWTTRDTSPFLQSSKGLEVLREVDPKVFKKGYTSVDRVRRSLSWAGHTVSDTGALINAKSRMTAHHYTDKINGQTRHHFVTAHPELGEVGHTTILEHPSGIHPIVNETVHKTYDSSGQLSNYGTWIKEAAISAAKVRHGLNPVSWEEFSNSNKDKAQ